MSRAALDAPRSPVTATLPEVEVAHPARHASPPSRVHAFVGRPLVACVILFLAYASLSTFIEPGGFVAADTGGKVATLHVMGERGTLDPSVGYWAAAADPTGALHPLHFTARVGDEFVQVTTLPMLVAAYPLYQLGGDRLLLALPMLGGVMCALAARALARRLGATTGWAAFWTVGLATPVAIYALSFWEHTLGLAAMLWAAVFLLDVVRRDAGVRGAAAVGLLFGAAATMRTEAIVYFVVAAATMCIAIAQHDRSLRRAIASGLAAGVAFIAALVTEYAFEIVTVGRGLRGSRVAGTAAGTGASLLDRAHDAATTLVGLNGFRNPIDWIVGAVIVAALVGGSWCVAQRERYRAFGLALLSVGALLLLARSAAGLGFVPGLLTASPVAAVGAFAIWLRPTPRSLAALAWCSIPFVWLSQYLGGAHPQWGGRYLLLSGALFAVVAVVVLARHTIALTAVVVLSVAVTSFGFLYLAERSRSVVAGMEAITRGNDQALISLDPHLFREGGAFYDSSAHWFTATDSREFARAVRIIRESGAVEFAALVPVGKPAPDPAGFRRGRVERIEVRPDLTIRAITYHAE